MSFGRDNRGGRSGQSERVYAVTGLDAAEKVHVSDVVNRDLNVINSTALEHIG